MPGSLLSAPRGTLRQEKAQEIAEIERLQCELQAQEETKAVAAEIIDCP